MPSTNILRVLFPLLRHAISLLTLYCVSISCSSDTQFHYFLISACPFLTPLTRNTSTPSILRVFFLLLRHAVPLLTLYCVSISCSTDTQFHYLLYTACPFLTPQTRNITTYSILRIHFSLLRHAISLLTLYCVSFSCSTDTQFHYLLYAACPFPAPQTRNISTPSFLRVHFLSHRHAIPLLWQNCVSIVTLPTHDRQDN